MRPLNRFSEIHSPNWRNWVKMMNETIDDIKDGDLAMPAIGLGLLAIIGFALYKGAKL